MRQGSESYSIRGLIDEGNAEDYIACLVKDANKLAIHAGRKTVKEEDVELAARSG